MAAFAGGALAAPDVSGYSEVDASSIKLSTAEMDHATTGLSELQYLIASTDLGEQLGNKKVFASWNIYTTVATGSVFTVVASDDLPASINSTLGAVIMEETCTPTETFAVFDTVSSITVEGKTITIPLTKSLTTVASNKTTWIFLIAGGSGPTPKPVKPVIVKPVISDKPEDVELVEVTPETDINAASDDAHINADNLYVADNGAVMPKDAFKDAAVDDAFSAETGIEIVKSEAVPVAKATVSEGKIATFAYEMAGSDIAKYADKLADLKVVKILSDGSGKLFNVAASSADFKDEYVTILKDGKVFEDAIVPADTYTLCAFVMDGGSFDLDGEKNGTVVDPMAVVKTQEKQPSGSSSSGCSAGFGALALLAFIPVVIRRKK